MADANVIGSNYTSDMSATFEESDEKNFDRFANNEQQKEMGIILFEDKFDGNHFTRNEHSARISEEKHIEALKSQFHTNQILCKFIFEFRLFNVD